MAPETTDTLAVNMAENGGILATATDLDVQLANTLCIVDSELVSYATATLTSAKKYALTYLYRGLYGTPIASHSSGARFARLDSTVFQYDLPAEYVGVELYIKLQSFNVFGGGMEDLSTCTVYTYTPTGAGFAAPIAAQIASGFPQDLGTVSAPAIVDDDFGSITVAATGVLDLGSLTS